MLPAIELVTSSEINPKTFELASSNSRKILFAVVTSRSSWIVCIYAGVEISTSKLYIVQTTREIELLKLLY